jgi:hypothetical protein
MLQLRPGHYAFSPEGSRLVVYSSYGHVEIVEALNDRTYAVPRVNAFSPAAAWCFPLYLCFFFALYDRKNETQKKIKHRSAEGKTPTA